MAKRQRIQKLGYGVHTRFVPIDESFLAIDLSVTDVGIHGYYWRAFRTFSDAANEYKNDASISPFAASLRKEAGRRILDALRSSGYERAEAALRTYAEEITHGLPPITIRVTRYGIATRTEYLCPPEETIEEQLRRHVGWELLDCIRPPLRAFQHPVRFFTEEIEELDSEFSRMRQRYGGTGFDLTPGGVALLMLRWGSGALLNETIRSGFVRCTAEQQTRLLALCELKQRYKEGRRRGSKDSGNASPALRQKAIEDHLRHTMTANAKAEARENIATARAATQGAAALAPEISLKTIGKAMYARRAASRKAKALLHKQVAERAGTTPQNVKRVRLKRTPRRPTK